MRWQSVQFICTLSPHSSPPFLHTSKRTGCAKLKRPFGFCINRSVNTAHAVNSAPFCSGLASFDYISLLIACLNSVEHHVLYNGQDAPLRLDCSPANKMHLNCHRDALQTIFQDPNVGVHNNHQGRTSCHQARCKSAFWMPHVEFLFSISSVSVDKP